MPRPTSRVVNLETALLQIGEAIDNCDQSRINLSQTMDAIRETVATAYGEPFEDDLADYMEQEDEQAEDDDLDFDED